MAVLYTNAPFPYTPVLMQSPGAAKFKVAVGSLPDWFFLAGNYGEDPASIIPNIKYSSNDGNPGFTFVVARYRSSSNPGWVNIPYAPDYSIRVDMVANIALHFATGKNLTGTTDVYYKIESNYRHAPAFGTTSPDLFFDVYAVASVGIGTYNGFYSFYDTATGNVYMEVNGSANAFPVFDYSKDFLLYKNTGSGEVLYAYAPTPRSTGGPGVAQIQVAVFPAGIGQSRWKTNTLVPTHYYNRIGPGTVLYDDYTAATQANPSIHSVLTVTIPQVEFENFVVISDPVGGGGGSTPGPVTGLTVCQHCCELQAKLTWNAVSGADSYTIWRNGTFLATTTAPSPLVYRDYTVQANTDYTYSVVANTGSMSGSAATCALRVHGFTRSGVPACSGTRSPMATTNYTRDGCDCD